MLKKEKKRKIKRKEGEEGGERKREERRGGERTGRRNRKKKKGRKGRKREVSRPLFLKGRTSLMPNLASRGCRRASDPALPPRQESGPRERGSGAAMVVSAASCLLSVDRIDRIVAHLLPPQGPVTRLEACSSP